MVVSIRFLIKAKLAESDNPDPYSVVDDVVAAIPVAERKEYLRDAVVSLVSTIASSESRARLHSVLGDPEGNGTSTPFTPSVQVMVDPVTLEERRERPPGYSPKRDLIRADWHDFLNTRMSVGRGEWKMWRDVTVSDLRAAAAKRVAQAESFEAEAVKYSAVADILVRAGVESVGDLSEDDMRDVRELAVSGVR